MNKPLYFSKNERTKQQRRDVVGFAVGVSLSQNRPPSPLMVALQERYIAGEIDLEELGARIDAEYLFTPPGQHPDAKYAPGAGPDMAFTHVYEPYIELNLNDAPTTLS